MNIESMSKDELKVYAEERGIELDMRKKLSDLIAEVKSQSVSALVESEEVVSNVQGAKFIKNTKTGLVFELTKELKIHKMFTPELVYCDKNGNMI